MYKSVNNEIAGNDNLQKKHTEENNLAQKQKTEIKRKKTLIVDDSIIKYIDGA